jgi:hypothetical protein
MQPTALGSALLAFKEKEGVLYEASKTHPRMVNELRSISREVDAILLRSAERTTKRVNDIRSEHLVYILFEVAIKWGIFWFLLATIVNVFVVIAYVVGLIPGALALWVFGLIYATAIPILFVLYMRRLWTEDVFLLAAGEGGCWYAFVDLNFVDLLENRLSVFFNAIQDISREYETSTFKCMQDYRKCTLTNHRLLCAMLMICCCADQILTIRKWSRQPH